ncbi:MAG: pyridoxamine 5'-phosphate oxidase family protein [Acidobacteria bacterium]|jgi:general stress protein 26|nr:pyridoxamine 5'-phosphate oxidase family protein [Acidobacteriota bacterium]
MTELEEKIWNVLNKPQTAALATISAGGAPWVRYVTIRADMDFTLNFCTALSTRKASEIAANPNIHLTCGDLLPPDGSAYLQIAGRAEIRSDAATRSKYWQEGWRRYFSGPDDPDYIIVFVHPSRIEYNAPGALMPEVWGK